jgi:Recombination directionality factor-like
MPILTGVQARNYVVGRIRAGDKDDKGRPHRLDGFRFTSPSPKRAAEIAELYNGSQPRPWCQEWEVYTKLREITIALPPGRLVIDQAFMRWSGGGPTMVCDGISTTQPQHGPCQCPQPADPDDEESVWQAIKERRRLAGLKTPQGCYPYTWINVALVDIGDFGVWRLLSKSENAAAEIIAKAQLLERARAAGQYLAATLALEYREARVDGVLRQYNVPVLRIDDSVRAIANGQIAGRSLADQLPPAPGEQRRAITSGTGAPEPAGQDSPPLTAQQIANAVAASDSRPEVERWMAVAKSNRVEDDHIRVPDLDTELYEPLAEFAGARWKSLPGGDRA